MNDVECEFNSDLYIRNVCFFYLFILVLEVHVTYCETITPKEVSRNEQFDCRSSNHMKRKTQ